MQIKLGHNRIDYEYYRIMQQLKALGITPSGNKSTDKARLNAEKNKIINKLEEKEFIETLLQIQEDNTTKEQLEIDRPGAQKLAELNRIHFGL